MFFSFYFFSLFSFFFLLSFFFPWVFFIFVFFCLSAYFLFFLFSFWCLSSYNYFLLYHSFFSSSSLWFSLLFIFKTPDRCERYCHCVFKIPAGKERVGRMTDQDEKKIEQDERPMTMKKKTQRKTKSQTKDRRERKEEKMHFCASDVETQPRPSQKKVLMNVELGTKRELGMHKKGLGLWPFPFLFSCSNDVLWAQKRLVFSRLWSAMQPPSSQRPLPSLINQVVLGHAGAGLDRALPVPLILAVPWFGCAWLLALVARWRVGSPLADRSKKL